MNLAPKTTVNLLGKVWEFVYDFETIFEWDTMVKKSLVIYPIRSLTTKEWIVLLYAGIHRQDPALKFDDFRTRVQSGNPMAAMKQLSEAIMTVADLIWSEIEQLNADAAAEDGKPKEEADPNPPQASPGTG